MKNLSWQRVVVILAMFATVGWICVGLGQAQTPPKYEPPTITSTAEAVYPINSIAFGTVILKVNLSKEGSIDSVDVLRDIPSLTGPAIAAVKKWKFGPAKLDSYGISSTIPVAFTFVPPNTGPRF